MLETIWRGLEEGGSKKEETKEKSIKHTLRGKEIKSWRKEKKP